MVFISRKVKVSEKLLKLCDSKTVGGSVGKYDTKHLLESAILGLHGWQT